MSFTWRRKSDGERSRLLELAGLFLKLGILGFGGPAAHIAMMEQEFVLRRKWLDRQHFLDLIGATNLIPGPNSTEMTMHIGYERAGWPGLFTAGACFIAPAAVITGVIGYFYSRYGALPQVAPFLYGIKPAVVGVIAGAVWNLGRQAVRSWKLAILGIAVLAAALFGVSEILALLIGGVLGSLWIGSGRRERLALLPVLSVDKLPLLAGGLAGMAAGVVPWKVFLVFLKIGALLYGGGYVLVAFLEDELVGRLGWLTGAQLLDAIAVGQITPGPVFTTATFVGYVIGGVPAAIAATVGIFLPSFFFVLVLNPLVPRLRRSIRTAAFLDAINVSAIALMVAVTLQLGAGTLTDWLSWAIAGASVVLTMVYRINAAWLVLGGLVAGRILYGLA